MNEKAKYLLEITNQLTNANNQLKTLQNYYNENVDIPVTSSRKSLEKGIQYNSPLEEGNEYIVIPQHIYVEMLEQIVSYYQQEAIKTSNEISRGLNHD